MMAAVFYIVPITAYAEEERVIILFKETPDEALVQEAEGKVNQEMDHIPAVTATMPAEEMEQLEKNPNVLAVEKDVQVSLNGQVVDWGISKVKAPAALKSGLSGKGVKIAVLDTGIAAHEDLKIAGGTSFTSYTKSYRDDNGHGTFVAGVIGAANNGIGTVGIAPEANLYAVKVLDQHGLGYLSDVIAGIDWAINNKMNIVNLSLSTDYESQPLKAIVDKAYKNNVLVVAAGGNEGTNDGFADTVGYPARYNSVIAVGATDQANRRATFSVTGPSLEVVAPGVNVESTILANRYGRMDGTSMAAPLVAGNLALLKQKYGSMSAAQLRTYLQSSVVDLGVKGRDNLYGFGLVQAPVSAKTTPVNPALYKLSGITLKHPTAVYNSAGKKIKEIAQGTQINYKVFSKTKHETLITVNKKSTKAYLKVTDVEAINSKSVTVKGIAVKQPTKVFEKASSNSKVIKAYPQGTVIKYKTYTSKWYKATIYLNGKPKTAYVAKSHMEKITAKPVTLKGTAVQNPAKVYAKASKDAKVVKAYPKNAALTYRTFSSNWHQATVYVKGKPVTGYISVKDVKTKK